jgi:hypothetical protein
VRLGIYISIIIYLSNMGFTHICDTLGYHNLLHSNP